MSEQVRTWCFWKLKETGVSKDERAMWEDIQRMADRELRYREALEKIAAIRSGLDMLASVRETRDYWARLCWELREIARAALEGSK